MPTDPTPDAATEAAKRLTTIDADWKWKADESDLFHALNNGITVARALLAERDGTAVDEAWLRAAGFTEAVRGFFERSFLTVFFHTELDNWYAHLGGGVRLDSRGQLLALLRGLGIQPPTTLS